MSLPANLAALVVAIVACGVPAAPRSAAKSAATPTPEPDAAARWWAHVAYLADDAMRGRETGSPEHRRAAEYVAEQFARAGLDPAGTAGFLQAVPLRSRTIIEARSRLALVRDGVARPVALGDAAYFDMRVEPRAAVEAPLVFAGHGLVIPEYGLDDFAGLDVTGKIVVFLYGSPEGLPSALAAHHQSPAVRWRTVQARGGLGLIVLLNPSHLEVPWERAAANRLLPAMALAAPDSDDTAGAALAIVVNPAHSEPLFAGSGHSFAEILADAAAARPLPRFALPSTLVAEVAFESQPVESHNVLGLVRGSDPEHADEYVVLTAHLDHLGVGAPVDGDAIYNGAMDNATGVATLVEAARFVASRRPRRSVLFAAVTAEEKGMLGSRHLARDPTVPRAGVVADINMDMFLPLFPLRQLMVLGLDESDLGDDVRAVAAAAGVTVQSDPEPQRNRFIRGDQYSFIREGVPAVALKIGYDAGSPEARLAADWSRERYHGPTDDLAQPIDRDAAVRFTDLVARLCVQVADRDARPKWRDDSFFRRFAR